MPPSDSKIIGNATIWNRDDEIGDGADYLYIVSDLYPYEFTDYVTSSSSYEGSSLEGPPNLFDYVTAAGIIDSVSLEPPPGFADNSTSVPAIGYIALAPPYDYGPENTSSSPQILNPYLGPEDPPEPMIYILYSRWPVENVTSSGIIDESEVKLYVP